MCFPPFIYQNKYMYSISEKHRYPHISHYYQMRAYLYMSTVVSPQISVLEYVNAFVSLNLFSPVLHRYRNYVKVSTKFFVSIIFYAKVKTILVLFLTLLHIFGPGACSPKAIFACYVPAEVIIFFTSILT